MWISQNVCIEGFLCMYATSLSQHIFFKHFSDCDCNGNIFDITTVSSSYTFFTDYLSDVSVKDVLYYINCLCFPSLPCLVVNSTVRNSLGLPFRMKSGHWRAEMMIAYNELRMYRITGEVCAYSINIKQLKKRLLSTQWDKWGWNLFPPLSVASLGHMPRLLAMYINRFDVAFNLKKKCFATLQMRGHTPQTSSPTIIAWL